MPPPRLAVRTLGEPAGLASRCNGSKPASALVITCSTNGSGWEDSGAVHARDTNALGRLPPAGGVRLFPGNAGVVGGVLRLAGSCFGGSPSNHPGWPSALGASCPQLDPG